MKASRFSDAQKAFNLKQGGCRWLTSAARPTEAFGCLHHAGGGPAERHRSILPSLHVATDAAHGPHHVLN